MPSMKTYHIKYILPLVVPRKFLHTIVRQKYRTLVKYPTAQPGPKSSQNTTPMWVVQQAGIM